MTVPELPYGKYDVTVSNQQKKLVRRMLVRPLIALAPTAGRVGDEVAVTLAGFGASESVLVTFDTGARTRSVVRVRAGANGSATTSFEVPAAIGGSHHVSATDESGHSTYTSFSLLPSLVAQSPVAAGAWNAVTLGGFQAGEIVELRWGSATGVVLKTKVTTATGSGDVNVLIPANSTDGKHSLWAIGDQGTSLRVTVTTFAPAQLPTETATSSPTAIATIQATATPSSAPTENATPQAASPAAGP